MALTPTVLVDCRIYFDTVDLTGFSNKVEFNAEAEELEKTTFGDAGWKTRVGGLFDSEVKLEGFNQAGDLSFPDDTYWADLGTNTKPLTLIPTPTTLGGPPTIGDLAYVNRVLEAAYTPGGEIGKLYGWSADTKGNWPVARGAVLHPNGTARTSSGTGTGVNLGALNANQSLFACLHVLSASGTSPTLAVKIQSDTASNFPSPVDRITFSTATTYSGQASSVVGAITHTWWRVNYTIAGTSPSFLFALSAGIAAKG